MNAQNENPQEKPHGGGRRQKDGLPHELRESQPCQKKDAGEKKEKQIPQGIFHVVPPAAACALYARMASRHWMAFCSSPDAGDSRPYLTASKSRVS